MNNRPEVSKDGLTLSFPAQVQLECSDCGERVLFTQRKHQGPMNAATSQSYGGDDSRVLSLSFKTQPHDCVKDEYRRRWEAEREDAIRFLHMYIVDTHSYSGCGYCSAEETDPCDVLCLVDAAKKLKEKLEKE